MIQIRKSNDRGHAEHGWLDSYHTFSFADYHDPRFTGFHDLLVINEDRVMPGKGFGTHGHKDMEIITYVIQGSLEHKDSLGTGSVLTPGKVQRMSAGKGVRHSEFNHSKTEPLHLLQIWISPHSKGIEPDYEEKLFPADGKTNRLQLLVSPDGADGSLRMNQNAFLYTTRLDQGKELNYSLKTNRKSWIQVVRGDLTLNGQTIQTGDGAAIEGIFELHLKANQPSEALVFDLP